MKPKIQTKLTIAFLCMGLVPVILATFIVIKTYSRQLDTEAEERIWGGAEVARKEIDQFEREALRIGEHHLESQELLRVLPQLIREGEERIISAAAAPLGPILGWRPREVEGRELLTIEDPVKTLFSLEFLNENILLAGAVLPVERETGIVGYLLVGYQLGRSFSQSLETITGLEVRVLAPEPREGEILPESVRVRDAFLTESAKEAIFVRREPYYDQNARFGNNPYKALYQPIIDFQGRMLGLIFFGSPTRYTFEAVTSRHFFAILISVAVMMTGGLSYTMARRISKRVRGFAEAARRVADGDLKQQIKVKSKDEMGNLASAFNQMTSKLRQMRELEEELRRKDRLAALGELSAGVAHEIRNPLGIIKNSAEILMKGMKETKNKELSGFIISEVNRLNKVITNFLDFARPQPLNLEEVDIREVTDRSLDGMAAKMKEAKVKVVRMFGEGFRKTFVDPEQLHQVFLNLTINALQAMPEGGTLTVSIQKEGGEIKIRFIDTGEGIPLQNREKVFNPFFSAKEGGAGLGLAVVHKIVESHGGKISVESREGEGSTFIIRLPVGRRDLG